jgi:DNA-binding NtrC family response regulator
MLTDTQVLPFSRAQVSHPMAASEAVADSPLLAGGSPAATQLRAQLLRVAPHFRTALLTGEQGCGDLETARALHRLSPARGLSFVVLPAAEAELRFTRPGFAPGRPLAEGMLYLPEAGRLSRLAQSGLLALLRGTGVWQHHAAQGGTGRSVVRVAAFAGQGLRPLVSAGAFSAELAALLESLRLALPPLRERVQDLPLLLEHVARTVAEEMDACPPQFSPGFLEAAGRLTWPGNLAQMHAVVRRLLGHGRNEACVRTEVLQASDLSEALETLAQTMAGATKGPRLVRLEQVAQEHIRAVLIGCGGNKLRAAEVLGISRSTLYRMLETTGFQNDWQMAG